MSSSVKGAGFVIACWNRLLSAALAMLSIFNH